MPHPRPNASASPDTVDARAARRPAASGTGIAVAVLSLLLATSALGAQAVTLPRNSELDGRGRTLLMAGQYRHALAAFEELRALDSAAHAAWLGIGRAQEGLGRRKQAVLAFRQYTARVPGDPAGHELLGWCFMEMNRPAEALRSFRDAQLLAPSSASPIMGSAMALRALGRRQEAFRALREATRLSPGDAGVWGYLASVSLDLERQVDAAGYWEEALRRDPGYFDTRPDERKRWEKTIRIVGPRPLRGGTDVESVASNAGDATDAAIAPDSVLTRRMVGTTAPEGTWSVFARGPASSGSGFVVSREAGYVLTNKHVVRSCGQVKVRADNGRAQPATVHALDVDDDLALLRTHLPPGPVASFRGDPAVRPGDDVVAVGYPLSGLLADQVNVSTGTVNAMAGLYNDLHMLQMSAPVQPGSSGGALFDASGNVVGVVVTKLNAKIVAEETGDIPQNVNFAVKGAVARDFLRTNNVAFTLAESSPGRSNADVGEIGRRVTVLIECWK